MTRAVEHGGGVDAAAAEFGVPRGDWLDLSTGINPVPYPVSRAAVAEAHRLPDSKLMDRLRQAAAAFYGIGEPALVVPAPGSQAVIQWLPRLMPPSRVAVVGPTYGEYAAAFRAAGHGIAEAADLDRIPNGTDVVVACNPNNPDGRTWPPERLRDLVTGGRVAVVDEAFADVAPDVSVAPSAGLPGLVVLRSTGKVFGLAGLRLGFALCDRDLAATLGRALGPWAVSGPAAAVGAEALADAAWIAAARTRLAADRERLDAVLANAGLAVVGGTDLYRLVDDANAPAVFDRLGRAGILVRRFAARPRWLRFGLPGDDAGFERLAAALAGRGQDDGI